MNNSEKLPLTHHYPFRLLFVLGVMLAGALFLAWSPVWLNPPLENLGWSKLIYALVSFAWVPVWWFTIYRPRRKAKPVPSRRLRSLIVLTMTWFVCFMMAFLVSDVGQVFFTDDAACGRSWGRGYVWYHCEGYHLFMRQVCTSLQNPPVNCGLKPIPYPIWAYEFEGRDNWPFVWRISEE